MTTQNHNKIYKLLTAVAASRVTWMTSLWTKNLSALLDKGQVLTGVFKKLKVNVNE